MKDLPWPRDLVTLLPQLHSRDKITCLQPVLLAVGSVRFSSGNAWELTGDHHVHFHYRKKNKGTRTQSQRFKWKKALNRESCQYVQLLENKQRTQLVVYLSVFSVSHLVELIIKTRTKLQSASHLLLSHSAQKETPLISPHQNWAPLCTYTASQKKNENLKDCLT